MHDSQVRRRVRRQRCQEPVQQRQCLLAPVLGRLCGTSRGAALSSFGMSRPACIVTRCHPMHMATQRLQFWHWLPADGGTPADAACILAVRTRLYLLEMPSPCSAASAVCRSARQAPLLPDTALARQHCWRGHWLWHHQRLWLAAAEPAAVAGSSGCHPVSCRPQTSAPVCTGIQSRASRLFTNTSVSQRHCQRLQDEITGEKGVTALPPAGWWQERHVLTTEMQTEVTAARRLAR